ncbi:hypothetical protein K469DRAFT_612899 [Zopfia rhizophila CBS 207.26]|uniref:ABM domain-containing protein n=1 Tax=Zopfia rhizophila CBS 207.26 TaxID=1314779 RepID=A0A6A6DA86_9PEZI|nr:hypothetical protein K469DRAFT_612899 [Zopfia rhizophila CBS 207.26]
MGPVTTEVVYVPLISGLDLATGENKKIWEETLQTITEQPGCLSLFWGRQIEHPDVIQMAVDWDKLESHQAFIANPIYGPFIERIKPFLSGPLSMYHAQLPTPSPTSGPFTAPVTECISLYFAPDHPNSTFDSNWTQFVEKAGQTATEAQGAVGGWVVEEVKSKKGLGKDGAEGDGKQFWAVIGWPSVEAHMKYRETEDFSKVVPYLREGPKAIEVHHVNFQKY